MEVKDNIVYLLKVKIYFYFGSLKILKNISIYVNRKRVTFS